MISKCDQKVLNSKVAPLSRQVALRHTAHLKALTQQEYEVETMDHYLVAPLSKQVALSRQFSFLADIPPTGRNADDSVLSSRRELPPDRVGLANATTSVNSPVFLSDAHRHRK